MKSQDSHVAPGGIPTAFSGGHTYRLVFREERGGQPKVFEFIADDPHDALQIARLENRRSPAELWCDGTLLCHIRNDRGDVWQILPANDRGLG